MAGITNAVIQQMLKYIDEPVWFARDILRVEPDPWQARALTDLARYGRVAIRSGHGVGKTGLEAMSIWWFIFTRPFPKIPCTAPTQMQLFDALWAETSKWLDRSPELSAVFEWQKTRIINRTYPERWFASARTSSKDTNLAGFHEDHLLFILDEASGISDGIFEVVEGALTGIDNKLLICGNPTRASGMFYRAFHQDREFYRTHKVSCFDSPRVPRSYGERFIKRYGIESNVVRVRVLGEFPRQEDDVRIALEWIEAAGMRELPEEAWRGNPILEVGVDPARYGDDETTIYPRIGPKALPSHIFTRQSTTKTAGEAIRIALGTMAEYACTNAIIKVDDTGVGGGVTDQIKEQVRERDLPITVYGINFNNSPDDKEHYFSWFDEAWDGLATRFEDGDIDMTALAKDDELVGQLSSRKYTVNGRGQIVTESKEAFKKRIKRSPDRSDGLLLAYAKPPGIIAGNADLLKILRGVKVHA
jgi:phage terminase large subunit